MYKSKTIDIPLYPCKLEMVVTDNVKKVNKLLGEDFDKLDILAFTSSEWSPIQVILNPNHKQFNNGIIAHEVHHIVEEVFRAIGEQFPCEEPKAYLTQFLFNKIEKFIAK